MVRNFKEIYSMKTDISKLRLIVKAILVENLKNREICRKYGVNSSTVSRYARDLNSTVLSWDELSKLDDEDFLIAIKPKAIQKFVQPDFDAIYATKLSHKKMSLEKAFDFSYYNQKLPEGYSFYKQSHLYDLFSAWFIENHGKAKISSVPCNPGDFLEIDFVGDPLHWCEIGTGIKHEGRVFVAAFKYSGLIYAQVFENETLNSWQEGTIKAFELYGVPRALSMDNAKALVSKPDKYVAELSVGMKQLCNHYDVIPHVCKVRTPKEKNVTEYSANLIETNAIVELEGAMGCLVAKDLADVNLRLKQKVAELNAKAFTNKGKGSRQTVFDTYEKQELKAAPAIPFEISEWKILHVDCNGWAKIDGNKRYLVDYHQRDKNVVCRLTTTKVYFYSKQRHEPCGEYVRSFSPEYQSFKQESLMHPTERALTRGLDDTIKSFQERGYALDGIVKYLSAVFNKYPTMSNYRRVMGVWGLCKKYGAKMVSDACTLAANFERATDYDYIKDIIHTSIQRINSIKQENANATATTATAVATSGTKSKHTKQKDRSSNEGKNLRGVEAFEGK